MNPIWLFTKVAGAAFLTAAGMAVLIKKFGPKPENVVTGSIHFRKSLDEFQKGVTSLLFGEIGPSADEMKKQRESRRIPIE